MSTVIRLRRVMLLLPKREKYVYHLHLSFTPVIEIFDIGSNMRIVNQKGVCYVCHPRLQLIRIP